MSNNNHNYSNIIESLESLYIDNLQLSLKNLSAEVELFEKDGILNVIITLPNKHAQHQAEIQSKIEGQLAPNFASVRIIFNSSKKQDFADTKVKHSIPNVAKIILTSSAKGGVGKSTTAVNLARAMTVLGYKVGIVDADIYGPTIPKLLGINKKPETANGKMLPIYHDNIYSISIGYIVDETQAAIWRGPMISKALYQLLLGVIWPKLDFLIIDMPPGTGDIYLSLAENFKIDGAVLITTPQNISQSILKKSIGFFGKTNIPIIGIIYNMHYYLDNNNVKHYIFGKTSYSEHKILGEVPIIPKISEFSDLGKSLVSEKEFKFYQNIAEKIIKDI